MKVAAIVVEYNPFHNGHNYHLNKVKEITGADFIIAIMSGNYVQRGEPAVFDKHTRSEIALINGIDLVLELPVCYSTSSAELFALGAISLIDKLGIVDTICFGSECGDIGLIKRAASVLINEPAEFKTALSTCLKKGMSFPVARKSALLELYSINYNGIADCGYSVEDFRMLINSPNNILGIEYVKALMRINSTIEPITITRVGNGYNDVSLDTDENLTSASAIRCNIFSNKITSSSLNGLKDHMPDCAYRHLASSGYYPLCLDDFSDIFYSRLIYETPQSIKKYMDVDDNLSHKILNEQDSYRSLTTFISSIKTKELTYSRISRSLLHILLNITSDQMQLFIDNDIIEYVKILGFRSSSSEILRSIQDKSTIKVITKLADAPSVLSPTGKDMFSMDIRSTQLYNRIVYSRYGHKIENEFRKRPLII